MQITTLAGFLIDALKSLARLFITFSQRIYNEKN